MTDDWENVESAAKAPSEFKDEDDGESPAKAVVAATKPSEPKVAVTQDQANALMQDAIKDAVNKLKPILTKAANKEEQLCKFINTLACSLSTPMDILKKISEFLEMINSKKDLDERKKKLVKKPGLNSGKGTDKYGAANSSSDEGEEDEYD
jgi:hypothetical protein